MGKWGHVIAYLGSLPKEQRKFGVNFYYLGGCYCAIGALSPDAARALPGIVAQKPWGETPLEFRESVAELFPGVSDTDWNRLQEYNDECPMMSTFEENYDRVMEWLRKDNHEHDEGSMAGSSEAPGGPSGEEAGSC